ncbi:thermonuclease family protein [Bacillus sp. EB106-08-02-XG196]|uniref:thermonuclease family protein n=1 Tax=Bacillus sp. EB106-08-02-XG196 TaxID=2737049 RepID=UPI0015C445E1|nr:thermonuclease family protein [Bacillus sp. EB106-08-02-XG196]NWQ43347.1 thermonuclease family protein [Bacillus sp. EB106-08-02-XG196]
MKKRMGGVAVITAATFLAFDPLSALKEETIKEHRLQVMENPKSEGLKGKDFVSPDDQVPVTLVETIDGDTIKVWVNGKIENVRYLLIDTPESKNPNMCVQLYAKVASLRNSELVKSGKLTLEFEQKNIKDSYGRLLAYVYVDGKSVQGTLLKEGYARVAYIMKPPYKYLEQYREEERKAKREKINIWSRLNFVTNWGFNGCLQ